MSLEARSGLVQSRVQFYDSERNEPRRCEDHEGELFFLAHSAGSAVRILVCPDFKQALKQDNCYLNKFAENDMLLPIV
jgi:hypothetical protein